MVVSLAAINIVGLRQAPKVSNLFTVGKLIRMIIFIATGLFPEPARLRAGAATFNGRIFPISAPLIYAFTGFGNGGDTAGELPTRKKDLPHALLIAIGVVAVLYILIQVVCVGNAAGS